MKLFYSKPIIIIDDMGQDVIKMSYTYDVYSESYPTSGSRRI